MQVIIVKNSHGIPMVITNIALFISTFTYSIIVSQSFMYVLALRNTQLHMDVHQYLLFRKVVDANMQAKFRYAVYGALVSSLALIPIAATMGSGLLVGCSIVAFLALMLDTIITVRGNLPINRVINSWSPEHYPANWSDLRHRWLQLFQYRQILNLTGFGALLVGAIFR